MVIQSYFWMEFFWQNIVINEGGILFSLFSFKTIWKLNHIICKILYTCVYFILIFIFLLTKLLRWWEIDAGTWANSDFSGGEYKWCKRPWGWCEKDSDIKFLTSYRIIKGKILLCYPIIYINDNCNSYFTNGILLYNAAQMVKSWY